MPRRLHDRIDAGQQLAAQLTAYAHRTDVDHPDVRADAIVLALPRGGVPVAYEVAHALQLPLDICIVRKLGVPKQRELAMGAIAPGGIQIFNHRIIDRLGISERAISQVIAVEQAELQRREQAYRGNRLPLDIRDCTVILVDDGIATGSTMRAAIAVLRSQHPQEIVVAVPVAPSSVCQALQTSVDRLVCLMTPEPFHAIALWYEQFPQTTDREVQELLAKQQRFVSVE
ncbi:MAG: phosphoribosyltransferase [Phormidesmis sp. RL_2_1]|nr:phosphoribosyltransferase [Phormidesmis sp. RL_2_1]